MIAKLKYKKNLFEKTKKYLKECMDNKKIMKVLNEVGETGVGLLYDETPFDTGTTAESWDYEIETSKKDKYDLYFTNDNEVDGVNIAILIAYGHGTRNGGYVIGDDFISPVLDELADELSDMMAKEVKPQWR